MRQCKVGLAIHKRPDNPRIAHQDPFHPGGGFIASSSARWVGNWIKMFGARASKEISRSEPSPKGTKSFFKIFVAYLVSFVTFAHSRNGENIGFAPETRRIVAKDNLELL
jgi:hypothetical protein